MDPVSNASQLLASKREEILHLAARHGARQVRVFGSIARGEADAASDIDLLVDFEPQGSLLQQAALRQELEELLGRPVDLVVEGGINPLLEANILSEAVPL